MNSTRYLQIFAVTLAALVPSVGWADPIIQIDFGIRTQLSSNATWNNLTRTISDTGDPDPATLTNMIDSTGAATTIDLAYSFTGLPGFAGISGAGANYDGSYPAAVSSLPSSAVRDGLYFYGDAVVTMALSGLNPSLTYDFLIYGARGNNGEGADYAIAGLNSDSGSISNVFNNSTETVAFTGIQPTAGGNITLTLTPEVVGGLNTQAGSINAMTITAVPEPASIAVVAAGAALLGLQLARRRRASR